MDDYVKQRYYPGQLEAGRARRPGIEIHATFAYADALREPLQRRDAIAYEPLRELSVCGQLAWYRHPAGKLG
ncbi:MAG TPA: hypothetical protein VIW24_23015 [Aldersonia sp.]